MVKLLRLASPVNLVPDRSLTDVNSKGSGIIGVSRHVMQISGQVESSQASQVKSSRVKSSQVMLGQVECRSGADDDMSKQGQLKTGPSECGQVDQVQ